MVKFGPKIVKLVNAKSFTSKAGQDMLFVRLGDMELYDSAEIKLENFKGSLKIGSTYSATLYYDKWSYVMLEPVDNNEAPSLAF
jgi:hypothetical protein